MVEDMASKIGRAFTPEQKREVIERLYVAWLEEPEQRLGQLIDNSMSTVPDKQLFYIEDYDLMTDIEKAVETWFGFKGK